MAEGDREVTEFAIERENSRRSGDGAVRGASGRAGDADRPTLERIAQASAVSDAFPDRVRRKYYVVEGPAVDATKRGGERRSGPVRVYADAKGEYLTFKATEARLSTRVDGADVARDMIAVAAHRGWTAVRVQGSTAFRREAWLEGSARGLGVRGYEPDRLDEAVVEKRRAEIASGRVRERASGGERTDARGTPSPTRAASDGRARPVEVGIAGVTAGLARSEDAQRRGDERIRAGRFRTLDRREAMRDPVLAAAHSQLAILERSLREVFPGDPRARAVVLEAARERIAGHFERGRIFQRAEVRVPGSARLPDPDERTAEAGRLERAERVKARERGRE